MANFSLSLLSLLLLLPLSAYSELQPYVVYLGEHSGEKTVQEIHDTHHSFLLSVKETEEVAQASLIYSYKKSINGLAALLTPEEAAKLSEMEGVVSVFPSQAKKWYVQTTRSWDFLGIKDRRDGESNYERGGLMHEAKYGQDVIVGLLDSGIWPESTSFSDEGMGPIPKSWKGICQAGDAFNSSHCNRKLIGARYYLKGYEAYYDAPLNTSTDYRSPRDKDGHGSHTSSIVGGRVVEGVSALGGFAQGTASGGAPLARLAMYKVCWPVPGRDPSEGNICMDTDMLAAIDDAIGDGVDVLSISIGTFSPVNYTDDGIAIGALHAVKRNIVVACSAGNNGPGPGTLSNIAPWIITVGASSIDRVFPSPVVLGNSLTVQGQSVAPYMLDDKMYPLVYAGDAVVPGVNNSVADQCLPGSLSPEKVKGKIVLCLRRLGTRVGKGLEVRRAGGAAIFLGNSRLNGNELPIDSYFLPGTAVAFEDATNILSYINSTKNPTAKVVPGMTVINVKPAPSMASFSSRGPNVIEPNILKPDITAPGINILASWSEKSSPTKLLSDHRRVKYNFDSGTSMSCPHVAGIAALLKAIHPSWSSAAIRSAIMTTARTRNNMGMPLTDATGDTANPFSYGSGHLDPTNVADPGLVYDASYTDYLLFLCGSSGLKGLDSSFKCPKKSPSASNLNYPSLSISKLNGTMTVKRTVTNVGDGESVYLVTIRPPAGVSVKIAPRVLNFSRVGEKKSFTITVKAKKDSQVDWRGTEEKFAFGSYTWTDGIHHVRSPMAVSLA
ncbi:PREDICTED: subtilisin-like protease SBT5.6 [Nelumbo nucifera]|uniref:Subtilisin-like protease SBT5.6 n=2 Tax=Nelumbo nucifera TaxID=4432 RepID=A0A1U8AZ49_NELNU|nr:PREDICTED: subtilisin-like protease SBT5.6 [Nelumbo nucifera]DAD37678.1 TPA_asm: hypothetical protein HUJ06_008319 [Nelumbo nucifera]